MKNLAFIFILGLSIVSISSGQNNQVENLYNLGVKSAGKAGSTTNVAKNIGYLETALKYFTDALKIEPRNIKVLLARAKTHKTLFEYEKAQADCAQALAFVMEDPAPNNLDLYKIYKMKGEIYEHAGDYGNAVASYRTALKYSPDDPGLEADISRSRLLAGDKDLSDEETEQAMNSAIGNLRKLPAPKKADPEVRNFLYPKPDNFYRLGLANIKKAKIAKTLKSKSYFYGLAYKNFSRSIERNPTFAEAYFQRSRINIFNEEEHLSDLNKLIELKPDFAEAFFERADAWKLDEYEKRLGDLTRAIELKPSDTKFLTRRGEVYLELSEFKKAIADLTESVKLDKNQVIAYEARARAFRALGKTAEAEADEATAKRLWTRYLNK